MRQIVMSLLAAYAASVTILAAWFGCRAYVFQRICAEYIWARPGGLPLKSFEENLTFSGVAQHMTGSLDSLALGMASIHSVQFVVVTIVAFLGCFAVAVLRRRSNRSSTPIIPKD